jgi:hypothetical protein
MLFGITFTRIADDLLVITTAAKRRYVMVDIPEYDARRFFGDDFV